MGPSRPERRSTHGQGGAPGRALLPQGSKDAAGESRRPTLEGMEKKLGSVPSIFRLLGHSPELLQGFLGLNAAMSRTALKGTLRELAYMKTSQLNGCDYCLEHHRTFGRKAGLDERQIGE